MCRCFLIFVFFILSITFLHAQTIRRCSADQDAQTLKASSPEIVVSEQKFESDLYQLLQSQLFKTESTGIIHIPVVVHVVYHSAHPEQNINFTQIYSQIEVLNHDFRHLNTDAVNTPAAFSPFAADCQIDFKLAQFDPGGNPTDGITRTQTNIVNIGSSNAIFSTAAGGQNIWDPSRYLNIWVCNIDGGSTLGTTTFPYLATSAVDGSIIDFRAFGDVGNLAPQYNKGRTSTHEIGHYLSLLHLWGDTNCGNDSVSDTPPQATNNFGCPAFPHMSSCTGSNANGDMFCNYMDYTDDSCMNMFTAQQAARMLACLSLPPRSSLKTSNGLSVNSLIDKKTQLSIFPNPAHNVLFIKNDKKSIRTLLVEDVLGRTMYKSLNSQSSNTIFQIDLSDINPGLYFVKVFGEEQSDCLKFVVQ